jgi:hypothetical protein
MYCPLTAKDKRVRGKDKSNGKMAGNNQPNSVNGTQKRINKYLNYRNMSVRLS